MASPANGTFNAIWLGARTTDTGVAVDDVTAEEARLTNVFLSEGIIAASTTSFMVDERGSGANMSVDVGSGVAENDYALIPGFAAGQENYLSRMQDATVNLVITASDPTLDRLDEIYLVAHDHAYDAQGEVYVDLEVRTGTASGTPVVPGPDANWDAYLLLAEIDVQAAVTQIFTANITDQRVWSAIELGGGSVFFGPDTDPDDLRIETDVVGGAVNVYVAGTLVGAFNLASGFVGNVDGVDVSAHASRHQPGGADAIATATPGAIQPDDGASVGIQASLARSDHKHAIVAAIAGTIQPDDAASEGASTSFSRSDHKHAIVAATPSTLDPDDANTEGASTSFARADHKHAVDDGLGVSVIKMDSTTNDSALGLTGSFVDMASVSFVPPGSWTTYTIIAWGFVGGKETSGTSTMSVRVEIGAGNGTTVTADFAQSTGEHRQATATHDLSGQSGTKTIAIAAFQSVGALVKEYAGISYIATKES